MCWPLREKNFKKERKKRHGNCESRKTVAGPRDLSPKKSMKIFVPESRKTVTMTLKKLTDQMKNGLRARLAHCSESRATANYVHREFRPRCSRRGKTREKIQGPKRQREAGQKTRKNWIWPFWGEVGGIVARIVVRIRIERPAVDEGRKKPSIIPNNRQRRGTEP